ncbi:MAG: serine/threonine-protein kinase [Bdellovibrionota bacterium]
MSGQIFEQLAGLNNEYDQIQKMAVGGMAEVYRARQRSLDRPVAIKRIRPDLRESKDIRERFKREARAAANLLHQNLAHVYDYREIEPEAYIIMEYIDGFDASDVIQRSAPLPIDVALGIASKVLLGLAYVHSHGMVHRDLKPENIRITTRGDVKIMDFGIAYDPSESNLTQPGVLIGSPHYLAPEQIQGGKIDGRVDIFAFGITLYEMLTGRRPFTETDTETVFARIIKGKYAPIEQLRSDVSPFIIRMVDECLQSVPAKRANSVKELSEELQSFILQNFTASLESRIQQLLMKQGFLMGDPKMVTIQEKTQTHGVQTDGTRNKAKKTILWLIVVVFLVAVIVAALKVKSHPF